MTYSLIKSKLFRKNGLINNGFWGLASTICQTIFISLFFIIVSRHYPTPDFAKFLIASSIYQLLVGFSSMGLGHWFIREYAQNAGDKNNIITMFIKIQTHLGLIFYLINIGLAFLLYSDEQTRTLAIILGVNIIFDNVIYSLKSINIARFEQKKSAIVMTTDALLRLIIGCAVYIYPISIVSISVLMVVVRLLSFNLLLTHVLPKNVKFLTVIKSHISYQDLRGYVISNWKFVVIASSSIILWRGATIIISKILTEHDVANYEVAYKVYSIFSMMAVIASISIYPKLNQLAAKPSQKSFQAFYQIMFYGITIFSITAYAFIQSYGGKIVEFAFGSDFVHAQKSLEELFISFLFLPTVLLQANMLIAMKLEKIDMILNICSIVFFFSISFLGFYYIKSISVITYSISLVFFFFHLVQSIFLARKKLITIRHLFTFYPSLILFTVIYKYLIIRLDQHMPFFWSFSAIAIVSCIILHKNRHKLLLGINAIA